MDYKIFAIYKFEPLNEELSTVSIHFFDSVPSQK